MNTTAQNNSSRAGHFVANMLNRPLSAMPEVTDAAKKCLTDWVGVALGARQEPAAQAMYHVVNSWQTQGRSRLLLGGTCAPIGAALANGTLAHCLDFDDTHGSSVAHLSGPTWAAVLALGMDRQASEHEMLAAFIAGFEAAVQTLKVASQDCCDGSAANVANVFFFLDSFFGYDIHSTYVV